MAVNTCSVHTNTDLITFEAREIVASFHQTIKGDHSTAALIRAGHRDSHAEMRQAKAAMRRGVELAQGALMRLAAT